MPPRVPPEKIGGTVEQEFQKYMKSNFGGLDGLQTEVIIELRKAFFMGVGLGVHAQRINPIAANQYFKSVAALVVETARREKDEERDARS